MNSKATWLANDYALALQKFPERKFLFSTLSGIDPDPVYTADDVKQPLELPGEFPYTRGFQPSGYRGKLWTMRQFAGFGSAEQTNARFHKLLQAGQTGLSTAFDLPTLMGLDADHPFSVCA